MLSETVKLTIRFKGFGKMIRKRKVRNKYALKKEVSMLDGHPFKVDLENGIIKLSTHRLT